MNDDCDMNERWSGKIWRLWKRGYIGTDIIFANIKIAFVQRNIYNVSVPGKIFSEINVPITFGIQSRWV